MHWLTRNVRCVVIASALCFSLIIAVSLIPGFYFQHDLSLNDVLTSNQLLVPSADDQHWLRRSVFMVRGPPESVDAQCGGQITVHWLNSRGVKPFSFIMKPKEAYSLLYRKMILALDHLLTHADWETVIIFDSDTAVDFPRLRQIMSWPGCHGNWSYGGNCLSHERAKSAGFEAHKHYAGPYVSRTGLDIFPRYMDGPLNILGRDAVKTVVQMARLLNFRSVTPADDVQIGYMLQLSAQTTFCCFPPEVLPFGHPFKQQCPASVSSALETKRSFSVVELFNSDA